MNEGVLKKTISRLKSKIFSSALTARPTDLLSHITAASAPNQYFKLFQSALQFK